MASWMGLGSGMAGVSHEASENTMISASRYLHIVDQISRWAKN